MNISLMHSSRTLWSFIMANYIFYMKTLEKLMKYTKNVTKIAKIDETEKPDEI